MGQINKICDNSALIDFAIQNLYKSESDVFLRELIQNARDSIFERVYRNAGVRAFQGKIELKTYITPRVTHPTILCFDNGVGVNPNDRDYKLFSLLVGHRDKIKNHIKSLETDENKAKNQTEKNRIRSEIEKLEKIKDNIVGEFGIGILSCFLISDQFFFISCTRDDNNQIRYVIISYKRTWHLINGIDTRQYEILDYNGDWNEFRKREEELNNLLQQEIEGKLRDLNNPQNDNSFSVVAIVLKDFKEGMKDQEDKDDLPKKEKKIEELKDSLSSNAKEFTQHRIEENATKILPRTDISGEVIRKSIKQYLELLPENLGKLTLNGVELKFDNNFWWTSGEWSNCINSEMIQEEETGLLMKIGLKKDITNASSVLRVYYNGFLVQENYANLLPGKLDYSVQGFVSLIGNQWEVKQSREEFLENQELFVILKNKIQKSIEQLVDKLRNITKDTPQSVIKYINERKSNVQFSIKLPGLPKKATTSLDKLVNDLEPYLQATNKKIWLVPFDSSRVLFVKWLDKILINIDRDQTSVFKTVLSEIEKTEVAIFIENKVSEEDFHLFQQQLLIKLKEKGLTNPLEISNVKSGLLTRNSEIENLLGTKIVDSFSKVIGYKLTNYDPENESSFFFRKKAFYVEVTGKNEIDLLGLDDGPKDLDENYVDSNYYFNAHSERIQAIFKKINDLNNQIATLKSRKSPPQKKIKDITELVNKIKDRYNKILDFNILELLKDWCI